MPDNLYHNVTERTVRNHGGKWCFWRVKSSVTLRSGDVFLSLGWIASNYNIEYCRNSIYYTKGKRYNGIDKYKHSGTLFASITLSLDGSGSIPVDIVGSGCLYAFAT